MHRGDHLDVKTGNSNKKINACDDLIESLNMRQIVIHPPSFSIAFNASGCAGYMGLF
jgi:hypothetical protein